MNMNDTEGPVISDIRLKVEEMEDLQSINM